VPLSLLAQNLNVIQSKIQLSARRAGRKLNEITIVAVTKTLPPEAWYLALQNKLTIIGESKIQEVENKSRHFKHRKNIELHLIGHLQRNKVKKAIQHFDIIQTVDSIRLLDKINKSSKEEDKNQKIFLQINTAADPNKFGFSIKEIFKAAEKTTKLQNITLKGIMTIPPQKISKKEIYKIYKQTRIIKDVIQKTIENKCQYLSMGMSNDFEAAIMEGATHIRIGAALFGER
jgi:pyridoxal phosphate enzyme (YggS family)